MLMVRGRYQNCWRVYTHNVYRAPAAMQSAILMFRPSVRLYVRLSRTLGMAKWLNVLNFFNTR